MILKKRWNKIKLDNKKRLDDRKDELSDKKGLMIRKDEG